MIYYPTSLPKSQTEDRDADQPLAFKDYYYGVNLNKSEKQLDAKELAAALNWKYSDYGKLVTREGVKTVTTASVGANKYASHIAYVPGATAYIYSVVYDTNLLTYSLYRLTGAEPTLAYGSSLGDLSGAATIVPFNGYGVVLDGSYIKTVTGTTLALAYDDGDGPNSFQYENQCGTHDATTALYSGSVTKCGSKITTQAWDAGYTIPLTSVEIWLSKTGSPTGDITAYLYNSDGSSLLATSEMTIDSSKLTTNATKQKFTFDLAATQAMVPETDYICAIDYSGGDSSNYISVYASSVSSGGDQYQYAGSWSAVTTKNPLIGVKPGRPPKGSFGDVKDTRLFVSGDPDNPGYIWFSNTGTIFDWSTVDGGGWVGAVDDNANNYAVGAVSAHYGDLYVIGKKEQPFLCKLTGAIPSEFALPPQFQHVSTNHKCLISVVNDVWFASGDAVNALSGVQEYGDVRAVNAGDPVKNKVLDYFSEDSFAGYNPVDGQYMLKMSGYDNILVCHTKRVISSEGIRHYPWTEYKLKNLTPTTFQSFNNKFYIGCTDGNIYVFDSTLVKDASTQPDYTLTSGITEVPYNQLGFLAAYVQIDTLSWSLEFKRDISFDDTGSVYTINSAGADFQVASLPTGTKIIITGSASNDGEYTVSSTATTTSIITVNEAIVDEVAGSPVSISLDYVSLSFYKDGSSTAIVTKTISVNDSPRREQINLDLKSVQWSLYDLSLNKALRFTGISLLGHEAGPLL